MNIKAITKPALGIGLLFTAVLPAAASQSTQFGPQQVITNTATAVIECAPIDGDGDGDFGLVAAVTGADRVTGFENNGDGTFTAFNLLLGFPNTTCVHVADMDGDGDPDVIAGAPGNVFPPGSSNGLRVFENNGAGSSWTVHVINQDVSGIWDVTSADMDGDGDEDVVICLGLFWDQIGWFPNNGNFNFGGVRAISTGESTSNEPRNIHTADVDGDGDMDVLAANYNGNDVSWYRNNAGTGLSWSRLIINNQALGARNVRTADVDNDGVLDIVTTSVLDRTIAWHAGLGNGVFGSRQVISTANLDARGLHVVDLDNDGDVDVLSTSETDNRVDWYENLGGGTFGGSNVITNFAIDAAYVDSADIDGDGDEDVISVSPGDNKIAWFENLLAPPTVGTPYCFGDGSGSPCPCFNEAGAGEGCQNDTGNGAILSASGSASIAADDLVLSATNLTSGPGLFFQGNNAVNSGNGNSFGDGLRCAGFNVVRLEVQFANAANGFTADSTISISSRGGVSVGDTKRYQFWYRDANGSPCNSGFNLTNGYEITWGP